MSYWKTAFEDLARFCRRDSWQDETELRVMRRGNLALRERCAALELERDECRADAQAAEAEVLRLRAALLETAPRGITTVIDGVEYKITMKD